MSIPQILRIEQAAARFQVVRSSYYRLTEAGLVPPPLKISSNRAVVIESEVEAVLAARLQGANDAAIRRLVGELVAKRADISVAA